LGELIFAVLANVSIVLFAIAIVTTIVKLRRFRSERRPANGAFVFWGETIFYVVGIGFIYFGIFHAYFARIAAPAIGWTPSPFEYELGWLEIGLGLVAVISLWRGFEFRLAATIAFVIFSLAAAAGHIQQILCCANYAPGNAGVMMWFSDIFIPMLLVVLAALSQGERA